MKILIPLQLASTRVKLKNVREFYNGDSLFDIKIKQLLTFALPSSIYVSSEDDRVDGLCKKYGINFVKRPVALTGNSIRQAELIGHFLKNIPNDDEDCMWVQVTQPLFNEFTAMMDKWAEVKSEYDSIVAVKTIRHHIINSSGIPVNFNFGNWHKVTQDLPPYYELLWSAFIQKRKSFEITKYQIGMKPYFMAFDNIQLVDIDSEQDFQLAREIYKLNINSTK